MNGIPHHLIDVVNPSETFTAQQFKEMASEAIVDIIDRDKLPIIAGGTGFYIQALVDNISIPRVEANEKLRNELEKKDTKELFKLLKESDPERAETIDPHNRRRLIRSLEIIDALGSVPKLEENESYYDVLSIGIQTDTDVLVDRINSRLSDTVAKGLIDETRNIFNSGISWERINEFGLEYKIAGQFIRSEIDYDEMIKRMKIELRQYAKRQKTWFKRDKRTKWFKLEEMDEIIDEVEKFLN